MKNGMSFVFKRHCERLLGNVAIQKCYHKPRSFADLEKNWMATSFFELLAIMNLRHYDIRLLCEEIA
jgi:hypothetical protein